jgi:hypothetical protein
LATNVPLTWRDPVTGAEAQPNPFDERSIEPDTARQDDDTAQLPTTLPPQGVTSEHDAAAVPLEVLDALPLLLLPLLTPLRLE